MTGHLKLGAIAEFINGGAWSQDEYVSFGVPVVRVSDVHGETVDLSSCKYLRDSARTTYRKHELRRGDIIVCTVGSHPSQPGSVVGRVGIVPDSAAGALLNQNAVCIRVTSQHFDQQWLGFVARSTRFRQYVVTCARGSANQVRMAIGLLKEMLIDVPPLTVQRRVARILSAYDDLIENNLRRIGILEEMARALYREWFVNFRFPGHGAVPSESCSAACMPDGWTTQPLARIATINQEQITPATGPPEIEYIDISSVSVGRIEGTTTYSFDDAPSRARRVVRDGDVLWSCVRPNRRSHALIIKPASNAIASTGFAVLSPKSVPSTYLYQATTTDDFVGYLTNHATGAAYPAVTASTFEQAQIVVPPTSLLAAFDSFAAPAVMQIDVLGRQNAVLRQTRDLLLPRLLSGQINLEDIEPAA